MDDIEESAATRDAPTSSARETNQRQTTVEMEDDEMVAMEVRTGGAMAKVSKYLVPEWVSNCFLVPEKQSYFAFATLIGKAMADYYIQILIVFLIEFLEMDPTDAVIVTNFLVGGSMALAIFVAYFTHAYVGHFLMLFLSALLYSVGLGILHSWYQKFTEDITKLPLYFALALIAIGIIGVEFSLRGFEPKEREISPKNLIEFDIGNHGKCYYRPRFRIHWKWLFTMRGQWQIFRVIMFLISSFVLPLFDFTWSRTFLILALTMGNSLIFLLLSILFYTPKKPNGSLRPYLFIFKAALMSKKNFNRNVIVCDGACAVEAQEFHVHTLNDNTLVACDMENCTRDTDHKLHGHSHKVCRTGHGIKTRDGKHPIQLTRSLRCLEKAVSIETRSDPDLTTQQEGPSSHQNPSIKKGSIHCTLQQVEEIKVFIRILPMSVPFIVFGMVIAAGYTFFFVQASAMRIPQFGANVLKEGANALAIQVLVAVSKIGNYGTAAAYDMIAEQIGVAKKRGCDAIKLGLATVLPILCCATASAVEAKRLRMLDRDYYMNVYWLVPQFFFIGAMEKMASEGIGGFFSHQTAPMMKRYAPIVAESMTGVGVLLSIPFQLPVVRETFGRTGDRIDYVGTGHLKKFYILLTVLSAGNFLLYVVLVLFYLYWKRKPEKDEQSQVTEQELGVVTQS